MDDNNILACIKFAKQERLACADAALRDYELLAEIIECPSCKGLGTVETIHGVERCLHPVHRFTSPPVSGAADGPYG